MAGITIEKADYIIAYYSDLMTLHERKALRHHRSIIKMEGVTDVSLIRMYHKNGWLTDDPAVLNYLKDGYVQCV